MKTLLATKSMAFKDKALKIQEVQEQTAQEHESSMNAMKELYERKITGLSKEVTDMQDA